MHCKKGCVVADLVKHYENIVSAFLGALLGHCEGIVRACIGEGIVRGMHCECIVRTFVRTLELGHC